MALIKNEVGDLICVFSKNNGKQSSKRVVITSHGTDSKVNGMESAPGNIKLVFYGPHGWALEDPSVANISAGNLVPLEKVTARLSQDYQLSKYTNSEENTTDHNKVNESYVSIAAMEKNFEFLREFALKQRTPQMNWANNFSKLSMDIITVRNRRIYKNPLLSTVLKELAKEGYCYEEVHCCFCRGSKVTIDPKGREVGHSPQFIPEN
jgi:hypothetical protein